MDSDTDGNQALPLSRSVYLETDDPETARREMSKILAPHAMTPLRDDVPFQARHHHARLDGMSVNYIQYRTGAHIHADLSRRFYLVHYVISGECHVGSDADNLSLRAGDVAVINPTEPFSLRTGEDCGQVVIKLPSEVLTEVSVRRCGLASSTTIRFSRQALPENLSPVTRVIDMICAEADQPASGRRSGHLDRLLPELLATALLEFLPHNRSDVIAGDRQAGTVAPWYVKRVEEFIELNAERPIRMEDMVEVAGVSERTLYNGFKTWRAATPKTLLKSVRLDRVRTELLGPTSKMKTVSEVARECGFRHMGNFARDYREKFGERPSDTRRFGNTHSAS